MNDLLDEQFLLEKMQQGKDATNLINNAVWRSLVGELQRDALDSFWKLANIPAKDYKEIQKAQNVIWRYTEMLSKLDLIMQQASQAKVIKEEELLDG